MFQVNARKLYVLTSLLWVVCVACSDDGSPDPVSDAGDSSVDAASDSAVIDAAPPCTLRYVDEDGDGFGTGEGRCADDIDRSSSKDGDCDDMRADVVPVMFASTLPSDMELPLDGVDSNCDELDYPFVNGPFEEQQGAVQAFGQPPAGKLEIPDAATCEGRGLSIVAVEALWQCPRGGSALHLGNRGDESVDGAVMEVTPALLDRDHPPSSEPTGEPERIALPDVAPGEVVRVVIMEGGTHRVRIVDPMPAGECGSRNQEGIAHGPFVDCR